MNFPIKIGLNARLFPNNWRPALQEIEFAQVVGFQAIQFPGKENGLDEESLGNSFSDVASSLNQNKITPVMEIIARLEGDGRTVSGKTPLEILHANLPAIIQLACNHVHWHLVPNIPGAIKDYSIFEGSFTSQFHRAVELAKVNGFTFGIEHNEPDFRLFSDPDHLRDLLESVNGLSFVWDTNHTTMEDLPRFIHLIPYMGMLHISDTLLPEVNYHLPIGMGNIDFPKYCAALLQGGFRGIGILEIGGLPKSGGYGRDTDDALIVSLERLNHAMGRNYYQV